MDCTLYKQNGSKKESMKASFHKSERRQMISARILVYTLPMHPYAVYAQKKEGKLEDFEKGNLLTWIENKG